MDSSHETSIDEGEGSSPPHLAVPAVRHRGGLARGPPDGERLATLGAGEVVGERGIVERGLRNASAVATDHPEVEQRLREILAERGG